MPQEEYLETGEKRDTTGKQSLNLRQLNLCITSGLYGQERMNVGSGLLSCVCQMTMKRLFLATYRCYPFVFYGND